MIKYKGGLGSMTYVSIKDKNSKEKSGQLYKWWGGSRKCVLVEMVGGNEYLQSLASHAKDFGSFSKENINS